MTGRLGHSSEKRSVKRWQDKTGIVNKFSGLLFCADCGARLYQHARSNCDHIHFQCGTYSYSATKGECSTHYISANVIENIVLAEINTLISAAEIDADRLLLTLTQHCDNASQKAVAKQKKELTAAKKRYNEIRQAIYQNL